MLLVALKYPNYPKGTANVCRAVLHTYRLQLEGTTSAQGGNFPRNTSKIEAP